MYRRLFAAKFPIFWLSNCWEVDGKYSPASNLRHADCWTMRGLNCWCHASSPTHEQILSTRRKKSLVSGGQHISAKLSPSGWPMYSRGERGVDWAGDGRGAVTGGMEWPWGERIWVEVSMSPNPLPMRLGLRNRAHISHIRKPIFKIDQSHHGGPRKSDRRIRVRYTRPHNRPPFPPLGSGITRN